MAKVIDTKCTLCGHSWQRRGEGLPQQCPACKKKGGVVAAVALAETEVKEQAKQVYDDAFDAGQEAFRRTVIRRWLLLIALVLLGYGLYEYVNEPAPSAPKSHRRP